LISLEYFLISFRIYAIYTLDQMMQGKWSKKPAIAKRDALVMVLLALLTMLLTTTQAFDVRVLPPSSHPLGKTYAQWSAK
jgi:hypothetical protein